MLFGNMLNLDRGIFLPLEERPVSIRPLSLYASEMLTMQRNLLEKSAAELLRTDLLHMSTKEFTTLIGPLQYEFKREGGAPVL